MAQYSLYCTVYVIEVITEFGNGSVFTVLYSICYRGYY